MIRFSASLVVVGVGLLIAGGVTSKLLLIYIAIGVSALALLFLIVGAILHRAELFGHEPEGIAAGPDGALWITLVRAGQIARLEPGGQLDLYELDSAACRPSQITTGPDRALWFTRPGDDRIGRITTGGETASFPIKAGSAPFGITAGPDDALWFTAMGTDQIARITTDGQVTEFALGTNGAMASMGLWTTRT